MDQFALALAPVTSGSADGEEVEADSFDVSSGVRFSHVSGR